MDPLTIVGIVEGSISLAVQCGSVAKSLNDLTGQYKHAKLTVTTLVQNLEIMQFAWNRIGLWSKTSMPTQEDDFTQRLKKFLETGSLVLDALEEDLQSYDVSRMTFSQRSRLVWNENTLQSHQNRVRDQAQSMSLLLQAIQLPTLEATANLLHQSRRQFTKSDESAFSIVPSELSSRISISTGQTSRRASFDSYTKMTYRPLCFEDDLFTARVYKRNYRNPRSNRNPKPRDPDGRLTIATQTASHQGNKEINKPHLQRLEGEGKSFTNILSRKASEGAESDGKQSQLTILVNTDVTLTSERVRHDLVHRVGSTSGKDGLYVKLTKSLEERISPSISASYVELVMTCGRGDDDTVKKQLALMPASTPRGRQGPALLGKYATGSFYFCPVHAAVFNGHLEVMRTLLHHAELEGDLEHVVEKTIGGTEVDRWRPLHVATSKGNLPMVKLLLEKGATVRSETGQGIQAAHLAARIGSISILEALFDAGAHVNCSDLRGRRPIHYISESQDLPHVIHYLGEKGADLSGVDSAEELTPLLLACEYGFTGNIEALLSLRAPVREHPSLQLDSALDTALRYSSSFTVQTLLKYGVIPEYCHYGRLSGLHTFIMRYCTTSKGDDAADLRILRLLLENIELLILNDPGDTVLDSLLRLGSKNNPPRLVLKSRPKGKVLEHGITESIPKLDQQFHKDSTDTTPDLAMIGIAF